MISEQIIRILVCYVLFSHQFFWLSQQRQARKTLHMRTPLKVVGSLDRPNIMYEEILMPIAKNLLEQKMEYPLTILIY